MPRLLEWLEETNPDVACLQEIKTQDEGFPADKFEEIGYGAIWHGQKSFNGVAILTKRPDSQKRPNVASMASRKMSIAATSKPM